MILNFVFIVYAALNTNGTCALDTETLNYRKLMQLYSVQKERNKPESVSCSSCTSSLASHILTYRTDTWHWCYWVTCLLVILFSCDIYPNRVMDWSTSGAVNKKKKTKKKIWEIQMQNPCIQFLLCQEKRKPWWRNCRGLVIVKIIQYSSTMREGKSMRTHVSENLA